MCPAMKFSLTVKRFRHTPAPSSSSRGRFDHQNHQTKFYNKLNINEEYTEAFRTKSYTEMWSKVHGQGRITEKEEEEEEEHFPQSPICSYLPLSEYLLEPPQQLLSSMIKTSNLHPLIIEYFSLTWESFKDASLLLHKIIQTRTNYRIIQRALHVAKRVSEDHTGDDDCCRFISHKLAFFSKLGNPLRSSNEPHFRNTHGVYNSLLERLATTSKKIARKAKVMGFWEKGLVGIATIPACLCSSTDLVEGTSVRVRERLKGAFLAKLGKQMDAAAKGGYTLNRDFETMGRLAKRLEDEIEHMKGVIGILCLNNNKGGPLKEVVKEFESGESSFLDQLEELEEHLYLCFLTINRIRMLVMEQM